MIAILVPEFPNVRRRSDVDISSMHEDAFREGYLHRENSRMIKHPVTIAIDQAENAMAGLLYLIRSFSTIPGTIRNVESATVIEIHVDRPLYQRRSGNTLQGITIEKRKSVRGELSFFQPVNLNKRK